VAKRGPLQQQAPSCPLCYIGSMDRSADWLKQAEKDLGHAERSRSVGDYEWAAFAAQQSAEKAVKALVQSWHGSARGHAVAEILQRLPDSVGVTAEILDAGRALDEVYLTSRYPNGFASGAPTDYFTAKRSSELIEYGRQILEFCRSKIPRSG